MDNLPAPAFASQLPGLRHRRNGWTAKRQARFIRALGETASVAAAAARAGMTRQAAYWLRRQPAAAAFRAAWDAALVLAWQQVEATALERVLGGETETWDRGGVRVVRHRPCAPHLLVQMVDRAIAAREKAEAVAAATARAVTAATIERVRAEIRALPARGDADDVDDAADADDGNRRERYVPPVIEDAPTLALRRLDDLMAGFADWDDAPSA